MTTTASPLPPDSWGLADDVFDRLEGIWSLDREIVDSATMQGSARFSRLPTGMLGYREQGRVRLPDGKEFDGSREYFFERSEGGFTVHFAETPMRLFHRIGIVAEGELLIGTASHLCVADTYDSRYVFHPDGSFAIEHDVRGPRKGYVSRTRFTRRT